MSFIAASPVLIDLSFAHFDHRVGKLRFIGTWLLDDSEDAVMAVLPRDQRHRSPVLQCIAQRDAWRWVDQINDAMTMAETSLRACMMIAEGALPFDPLNARDVDRFVLAVQERIDDLVKMPARPSLATVATGEVSVTNRTTDRRQEMEMRAHVIP